VLTGATTGGNPPARRHRIFWKQLDVLGSTMASDSEFRAVTRLFAQGRIRPLVDSVRPLEEVRDAHRRLEAGQQNGKLVLEIAHA
jgi:D-arabinose 1-dehydrogenase-like Zn-dependent alcohol dehydrogenase